ncbi:lipase maturation factor family protein, partial [Salmonella enterica]|uniref:lipase maturation factor family protein n=1 Tax=Salmonella enterica TaxID=28901 RepID=UPI003D7C1EBA
FQPRLDWQMWFASLGDISQSPWFPQLILRLFNNTPSVTGLLKSNPFPNEPPLYLRARLFRYTFSSWDELCSVGQWWRSDYIGAF